MNCQGYFQHIRAYCERELGAALAHEVEEHAVLCATCGEFHEKAMEITCREIAELYEYVAGTLDARQREIYDRHFTICQQCRDYLDSYRKTMTLARAAEPKTAQISESLLRSILSARRQ